MRLLLVCLLCALATAAAKAPEGGGAPATRCVGPTFQGVEYRLRSLSRTWVRVGAPVGEAEHYRIYELGCLRQLTPVHRIRGVDPAVAVSFGGASRRLLIRRGVCSEWRMDAAALRRNEGRLLRCLRGG